MAIGQQLIALLLLLQIKHLIVDWFWQTPVELQNKGHYLHKGGIHHAAKHAIGTLLCRSVSAPDDIHSVGLDLLFCLIFLLQIFIAVL